MTPLAVVEGKRDLSMARAAIAPFYIGEHGVACGALFRGRKYFGVAELTAVPRGVLFVREDNRLDPGNRGLHGEVSAVLQWAPGSRNPFNKIYRLNEG